MSFITYKDMDKLFDRYYDGDIQDFDDELINVLNRASNDTSVRVLVVHLMDEEFFSAGDAFLEALAKRAASVEDEHVRTAIASYLYLCAREDLAEKVNPPLYKVYTEIALSKSDDINRTDCTLTVNTEVPELIMGIVSVGSNGLSTHFAQVKFNKDSLEKAKLLGELLQRVAAQLMEKK